MGEKNGVNPVAVECCVDYIKIMAEAVEKVQPSTFDIFYGYYQDLIGDIWQKDLHLARQLDSTLQPYREKRQKIGGISPLELGLSTQLPVTQLQG